MRTRNSPRNRRCLLLSSPSRASTARDATRLRQSGCVHRRKSCRRHRVWKQSGPSPTLARFGRPPRLPSQPFPLPATSSPRRTRRSTQNPCRSPRKKHTRNPRLNSLTSLTSRPRLRCAFPLAGARKTRPSARSSRMPKTRDATTSAGGTADGRGHHARGDPPGAL